MGRTHKAKAPDQPDDFAVALGKPDGGYCGGAFEAWKTGRLHQATLLERRRAKETPAFAFCDKFVRIPSRGLLSTRDEAPRRLL